MCKFCAVNTDTSAQNHSLDGSSTNAVNWSLVYGPPEQKVLANYAYIQVQFDPSELWSILSPQAFAMTDRQKIEGADKVRMANVATVVLIWR